MKPAPARRITLSFIAALPATLLTTSSVFGQIVRWDTGAVIPGTEGIVPGPGVNLQSRSLSFAQLSSINLTTANLSFANLVSARLTGSSLTSANLSYGTFNNASFRGADLTRANVLISNLRTADFTAAIFRSTVLINGNFTGSDFTSAVFTSAVFRGATLVGATFTDADIRHADLSSSLGVINRLSAPQFISTASYRSRDLTGVQFVATQLSALGLTDFRSFTLASTNFSSASLSTADFTSANLARARFASSNLASAKLASANLFSASFDGAVLDGTDFTDTDLRHAWFGVPFQGAPGYVSPQQLYASASYRSRDLTGLRFRSIALSGFDLSSQNLVSAGLVDANLAGATLASSDLTSAIFWRSSLSHADLSSTTRAVGGLTSAALADSNSFLNRDITGLKLRSNSLVGWNLASFNLTSVDFSSADLSSASLTSATLARTSFLSATLASADFSAANLASADLTATTPFGFTLAQFRSTASFLSRSLPSATLDRNDFRGWDFASLNLTSTSFRTADLTSASLRSATLARTSFLSAILTSADFTAANLASVDLTAATSFGFTEPQFRSSASYLSRSLTATLDRNDLRGWDLATFDLNATSFRSADLSSASLRSATVTRASFLSATLTSTDFSGASLTSADLTAATSFGFTESQLRSTASFTSRNLTSVVFDRNDLIGWDLSSQNLASALFRSASLASASLRATNLRSADLTGADLTSTDLSLSDLRNVIGFSPTPTTTLRAAIRPDSIISPEPLVPGDVLLIRPTFTALPAGLTGTLASSDPASNTPPRVTVAPAARLQISTPAQTQISVRPLDHVALEIQPGLSFPSQVSVASVTTVTATFTAGRTAAPLTLVLPAPSLPLATDPTGSRTQFLNFDLGTNDAVFLAAGTPGITYLRAAARTGVQFSGAGLNTSFRFTFGGNARLAVTLNADRHGLPLFSTFNGLPVSAADALVKFTWNGDVNLDGILDARDYNTILSNFSAARTNATWLDGDLNYDGRVDSSDWSLFLPAYTAYLANPRPLGSPLDFSAPSGAIPEPAALSLLALPALLLPRRARRA